MIRCFEDHALTWKSRASSFEVTVLYTESSRQYIHQLPKEQCFNRDKGLPEIATPTPYHHKDIAWFFVARCVTPSLAGAGTVKNERSLALDQKID